MFIEICYVGVKVFKVYNTEKYSLNTLIPKLLRDMNLIT